MRPVGPSISAGLSPSLFAFCKTKVVIGTSGMVTSGKGARKIIFVSFGGGQLPPFFRLVIVTGVTLSGDRVLAKGLY